MNHRVHSLIRGCLTLKFSGSWKTVTFPSPALVSLFAPSSEVMLGFLFSSLGEMGMVSRGTGELGLILVGAVASVAIAKSGKKRQEGAWRRLDLLRLKLAAATQ